MSFFRRSLKRRIAHYLIKNGINIYGWERVCYKCKKTTTVYSYYLMYDLFADDYIGVGLGDIECVDEALAKKYSTIKRTYSHTINDHYIANICEHCGALQGKNYVVDDPHEIWEKLVERKMGQHLVETLSCKELGIKSNDIIRSLKDVSL